MLGPPQNQTGRCVIVPEKRPGPARPCAEDAPDCLPRQPGMSLASDVPWKGVGAAAARDTTRRAEPALLG
jgi:hypothetical protein